MRDIVLSVRDFRHLVSFVQDDELLWKLLKKVTIADNRLTLQLSPEQASELQEYLGDLLCQVGFDESYEPTEAGRILESLIDLLAS
jgi:hypothetical protein